MERLEWGGNGVTAGDFAVCGSDLLNDLGWFSDSLLRAVLKQEANTDSTLSGDSADSDKWLCDRPKGESMNLVSMRVITEDVERLVSFYEKISGLAAIRYTPDFAELRTPGCTLAIGSTRTLQLFGASDVLRPAENRSAIIEFFVEDVDTEFVGLKEWVSEFVQEPTTMPWGNRSLLFRDPDGNLINFFTPVNAEAKERFKGQG
jgi:predicted enzyme related to lactoylglutathione lyase